MGDDERPGVTFEERQRFRQVSLVFLVGFVTLWAWVALVIAIGRDDRTAPVWVSWMIAAVFGLGLPWLLWSMELRTTVGADGVAVRFVPRLGGHRFTPAELASARAVTYHPLREFGGWGIRWGPRGARAYSVSGHDAAELVDDTGRRWIIGSRQPDDLVAAIVALGVPTGPSESD